MTRRRKVTFEPTNPYHRHDEPEWGILKSGDYVKVEGVRGDFLFTGVVVDDLTNEVLWVNLYGPRPTHAKSQAPHLRSIATDRIKVPTQRVLNNRRKAKLT